MIDTVALTLACGDFEVLQPDLFSPARILPGGGWRRCQNPPRRTRAASDPSRPTLTWTWGAPGRAETLRMECSIPKVVFKSNVWELEDTDSGVVLQTLSERLSEMGVRADESVLWEAPVSAVHFGKNVKLPDGVTCATAVRELASHPQRATWDNAHTIFRNGGHGFRLHLNRREVVFYDKHADLLRAARSPRRAEDPASGAPSLRPSPTWEVSHVPILRMETRYSGRAEVRSILETIGRPSRLPRLCDVFRAEVAMKVLLHELRRFETLSPAGATSQYPLFDSLRSIRRSGATPRIALVAAFVAALEQEMGAASARAELVSSYMSGSSWYRLSKVARSSRGYPSPSVVAVIKDALLDYVPLRLTPRGGALPPS